MKIKDILNECNIRWLYETTKVVDNVDRLSNNLVTVILNHYQAKNYMYYTAIKNYDGTVIKIPNCNIKFRSEEIPEYVERSFFVNCTIFLCDSKQQEDDLVESGLLHCMVGYIPAGYQMEINFCFTNGKYKKQRLLKDISHELTHTIQAMKNSKLKTKEERDEHQKQYGNITSEYMKRDDGIVRDFIYLCYYFTRLEISANVNGLYTELINSKITKNDYQEIYQQTLFYGEYKNVLKSYRIILNSYDKTWNIFRTVAQTHSFYKETLKLNTTTDIAVFKKYWIDFINRMIDYTNNSIEKVIYKAITDINQD
jgi:hypothetical protein